MFLQESLLIKAGDVQNVTLAENHFRDLPVYEKEGKSIECLNAAYNDAYLSKDRGGMNLLTAIVKLLNKQGQSKADILTYYIQLRGFVEELA